MWFVVDLDEFDSFIWELWPDKVMNLIFILIEKFAPDLVIHAPPWSHYRSKVV